MNYINKYFKLILFFGLLVGCTHSLKIVDIQDGSVIKGEYKESRKVVKVFMPDGEILTGNLSKFYESSTSFGSATGNYFPTSNQQQGAMPTTFSTTSLNISSSGQAYCILTGEKGTVMEILLNYTGNQGFGDAVTNKKKKYKVQMFQ